jgi:hypothetical protein
LPPPRALSRARRRDRRWGGSRGWPGIPHPCARASAPVRLAPHGAKVPKVSTGVAWRATSPARSRTRSRTPYARARVRDADAPSINDNSSRVRNRGPLIRLRTARGKVIVAAPEERRRAPRPCPPNVGATCWLHGGSCAACIPQFAQEAAGCLLVELSRTLPAEEALVTARQQAIRLVRHFNGENLWIGSAERLDRQSRDADIRRMLKPQAQGGMGKSIAEVARASGLSHSQVRRIRSSRHGRGS